MLIFIFMYSITERYLIFQALEAKESEKRICEFITTYVERGPYFFITH